MSAPAHRPAFLSVYDGRACTGFILNRGKLGFEALDADERSLGIFSSTQDTANAISARSTS
jgi:hypothetical protein